SSSRGQAARPPKNFASPPVRRAPSCKNRRRFSHSASCDQASAERNWVAQGRSARRAHLPRGYAPRGRGRRGRRCRPCGRSRRVEEMRAEPVAAEIVAEAFSDFVYGQTAGIGGNDGSRAADFFDSAQQLALGFQILDDRFDDPIAITDKLEIVIEVAYANHAC